jgi:hypothetical protein
VRRPRPNVYSLEAILTREATQIVGGVPLSWSKACDFPDCLSKMPPDALTP